MPLKTTTRVHKEATKKNVGGRPPKPQTERATVKLNCWVTQNEQQQILAEFDRARAGTRLKLAVYLKQKLLGNRQDVSPRKESLGLTILIQLQERGRQLEAILEQLKSGPTGTYSTRIPAQIEEEMGRIRQTLIDISEWLYES